ncbi:MAG: alanine--tRNA ligase [Candidatus Hydrothermarchaeota archaeon]
MSEYEVELFRELDFVRKECESCKRAFWTLVPERKTCGEPPCDEYTFIENSPMKKPYSLHRMREEYLKFFEDNDHTRINRYPVVARWRDDILLTIASIACFQPWVLSGEVDPPYNPLTMSQPSIRLNDIDNVGRTGRHFTLFEMMAHHAFNTKDRYIYFKDDTVRLCHELLTDRLGVKPERITYIEEWWEGGGNAGPCFEAIVDGAELATLVFMQYEGPINGEYREMDMKVVDTGYGLERFTWVSQGTPTAYDAVFDAFLVKLKKLAGVKEEKDIVIEHAKLAGLMDIMTLADVRKLRKKVAEKIGIDVVELSKIMEPLESIYTLADHSRCISFMFGDGIVPSNVREGYLARLVLRRALRFLKELELDLSFSEIVAMQIEYLGSSFPELIENMDTILDEVNVEEKRYKETLKRGERLVLRTVSAIKKRGKKELDVTTLINLYDSQGIPPEIVREIAKDDIEVNIPDDFYAKVAELHQKREEEIKEEKIEIKEYPPTELLFYKDPNVFEFKANVIGLEGDFVILDKTYFYPEGGGQPCDTGYFEQNGREVEVIDVQKVKNVVVHRIRGKVEYGEILGKINKERRLAHVRHHTATHLVMAAARNVLGNHIWQAGAQKGEKSARIDLTHYQRVTKQQLRQIERLANEYVMKNLPVRKIWMERNQAEKKYGFRLYQGGVVPGKNIRILEINNVDAQACAGTHVDYTGEIGTIKIIRNERIQDGVERFEFSAGLPAIEQIQELEETLESTAGIFKVPITQTPETARRFFTEWKELKKDVERLQEELASLKVEELVKKGEKIGKSLVIKEKLDLSDKELEKTAIQMMNKRRDTISILRNPKNYVVVSVGESIDVSANDLIKEITSRMGGGGGGKKNLAKGSVKKWEDDALKDILSYLRTILE